MNGRQSRKRIALLLVGILLLCALLPQVALAAEWQTYLSDDFSSAESMFYSGQAGEAHYAIDDQGRYVIDGMATASPSLSALTDNLYYYYLETECEVLGSTAGDLAFSGLVFHYNTKIPDKRSYYVFYIYGDGYYGSMRVVGDDVDIIMPLTRTDEFVPGGPNKLGVDAQGTRFDLYINGKYVDGFTDVRIDGGGYGFYASKYSKAAFDNFSVKIERRGGGKEAPVLPVAAEQSAPGNGASFSFMGYTPPVIPRDPNRPIYPWEVDVDRSGTAAQSGQREPNAPAQSEQREPSQPDEQPPPEEEKPPFDPEPEPEHPEEEAPPADPEEETPPAEREEDPSPPPPPPAQPEEEQHDPSKAARAEPGAGTLASSSASESTPEHTGTLMDEHKSSEVNLLPADELVLHNEDNGSEGVVVTDIPLLSMEPAETSNARGGESAAGAAVEAARSGTGTVEQAPSLRQSTGITIDGDDWGDPNGEDPSVAGIRDSQTATSSETDAPEPENIAPAPLDDLPLAEEEVRAQHSADAAPAQPGDGDLPLFDEDARRSRVREPSPGEPAPRAVEQSGQLEPNQGTPLYDVAAAGDAMPVEPGTGELKEFAGLLRIDDDFSEQRWPVSEDGLSRYRYFGAAYEIDNLRAETMAISYQEDSLADCEISIDLDYLDGPSFVGYGLAGRFVVLPGSVSYYGLFISGSGEFLLLKVLDGAEYVLQEWTSTSRLNPTMTNRITLELIGGTIRASINGEVAATVYDNDIKAGGYALLAGPGLFARYDNLTIRGTRADN
ncbi:hypothetical protein IIA79_01425 [bacterium]|nr:hypothetical protein [bacterium]